MLEMILSNDANPVVCLSEDLYYDFGLLRKRDFGFELNLELVEILWM